jgi:mono/diheme cytochrome c family protein
MKALRIVLLTAAVLAVGGIGFVYSGLYPISADTPHTRPVYWLLETLRERSIARAIRGIEVPDLSAPQLLLAGGPDYNDMCAGCHLKPGRDTSDLHQGLYPQPPNLAMAAQAHGHGGHGHTAAASAARQFWIIKHGIKASGMAAFGPTHDDERIWAMVAFLQKLPELTPAQYQILTARDITGPMAGHDAHTGADSAAGLQSDPEGAAAAAMSVLDAFGDALQSGDTQTATRLMSPTVLIYEGGGAERSRDEYASHHMQADMAFLK